jgi:hypothetical protein
VTRRKVDIGTSKFGVDLENNVCAVLTFGIGNVFHLKNQRDEMEVILDYIEKKFLG